MSPSILKPLNDRLVVELIAEQTQMASGLVLPDTAKGKPQKGKVIAIGPGRRKENRDRIGLDVAVGDIIFFARYSGTQLKRDGRDLLILQESDVLAIFDP